MRFLFVAVIAALCSGRTNAEESLLPPQVYVSKGACPFECCRYGHWLANRTVDLLDRPGGSPITHLRKGEMVTAITGQVETHPLRFQINQKPLDHKINPVAVGSVVYLLYPVGEGVWSVWFRGKVVEMDPQYLGPGPKYQWWAEIRTQAGRVGWVHMNTHDLAFDHVDACE